MNDIAPSLSNEEYKRFVEMLAMAKRAKKMYAEIRHKEPEVLLVSGQYYDAFLRCISALCQVGNGESIDSIYGMRIAVSQLSEQWIFDALVCSEEDASYYERKVGDVEEDTQG